jgi:membrane protein DedA with SNARE-associated domain
MISPATLVFGSIAAAFITEDLTCIGVGLLIASGQADPFWGTLGCLLGIFLSDLSLWALGRHVGRPLLEWRWISRRLSRAKVDRASTLFDRHGAFAVVVARFIPGSRLPFFVVAGVLGKQPRRFVVWTLLASLLWTPLVVLSVAYLGDNVVSPLWFVSIIAIIFASLAIGRVLWRHHEFWPAWLFYLPLLPWLAWLSLRYRSFTVWTSANPGIPAGGVVGESKQAILEKLPRDVIIPSSLIEPGDSFERIRSLRRTMMERDWNYPLILKPDAAQRGAGVKKIHDDVEMQKYVGEQPGLILAQPYHVGPFEAGIFYYRLPGEARGRIFSITDKEFPVVVGDGRSTLEELIESHPRYRQQAAVFLERHDGERSRILEMDERFPLTVAGNHCQGTLFRDGAHLITPQLERRIDDIAQSFDGFFIGRFDVRYSNVDEFKAGRDLAIVELNGATSESTNIYDPAWSLGQAYSTLFRQWSLLYRIGNANRKRGRVPIGAVRLLLMIHNYYRQRRVTALAD